MRSPVPWIAVAAISASAIFALVRLVFRLKVDAERLARRLRTQSSELTRRQAHLRAELQVTQDRLARLTRRPA